MPRAKRATKKSGKKSAKRTGKKVARKAAKRTAKPKQRRTTKTTLNKTVVETMGSGQRIAKASVATYGTTKSGKRIPAASGGPYHVKRKWRGQKLNVPVSVTSFPGTVPPAVMSELFPGWTKADHADAAAFHGKQRGEWKARQSRLLRAGEKLHGAKGPVISGGFHQNWPSNLKDAIREAAHSSGYSSAAAHAHAHAARYGKMPKASSQSRGARPESTRVRVSKPMLREIMVAAGEHGDDEQAADALRAFEGDTAAATRVAWAASESEYSAYYVEDGELRKRPKEGAQRTGRKSSRGLNRQSLRGQIRSAAKGRR